MTHRFRLTRTDVALSLLSAVIEAAGVAYYIHRKGWFHA